jgi:hypothetical protein
MTQRQYLSWQTELETLCKSARDAGEHFRAALGKQDGHLCEMLGLTLTAVSSQQAGSEAVSYRHLPAPVQTFARASAAATAGTAQLAARALLALSVTHPRSMRALSLPPSVLPLYLREFRRILEAIHEDRMDIDLFEDRWRKNLAILHGRLIPVGAEFADIGSGLPRSTLLRGSFVQRLRVLRCVMTQTRGFKPMLELHAHPDSLDDFSPGGWLESYKRLAEILAINPEYKGVIASSWFRDPVLSNISPRLSYLREYPEAHGASMVKLGMDRDGSSGALARSPTRRSLFEQGQYVPAIYLMIWPREAMLAWARDNGATID